MEIPVLVEPSPTGFRAVTGAPLDLSADGPTADAAMSTLRTLVAARLRAGQLRTLTVTDVDAILAAARAVGENPLFEEYVKSIEEYRRERDAEDRAADDENGD